MRQTALLGLTATASPRDAAVLLRVSMQRCARCSLHTHPCRLQTHTASDATRARSGCRHGPSSLGISSPLLTPCPPMEGMEPAWAKRRQTGGKTPCSAPRVSAHSDCSAAGLLMNKHKGKQSALRCPAGRHFAISCWKPCKCTTSLVPWGGASSSRTALLLHVSRTSGLSKAPHLYGVSSSGQHSACCTSLC